MPVRRPLPSRSLLRAAAPWLSLALWAAMAPAAHAVPSFARQTGSDCAACHVGGYGPQLTPYGIKFKLGGYLDNNGKSSVPLSGMVVLESNRQKVWNADANQAESKSRTGMSEASLFVAGKLAEHLGSFVQVTRSAGDGSGYSTSLDQADVRVTTTADVGGKDAVLGVSFNNNPTVQDAFNTLSVWSFPYTGSDRIANYPGAGLAGGDYTEGRVLGVNAYAFIDNQFYGELGTYNTLSPSMQSRLGVGRFDGDNLTPSVSNAPYWRLAYMKDLKTRAFNVGVFGFSGTAKDRAAEPESTKFKDIGIDGGYQFLGNREHIVTVNGSLTRSTLKQVDADTTVRSLKLATSYHWLNTYGATVGYFKARSTETPADGSDSVRGGNSGLLYQVDYTPFGKEDSAYAPWANLRVGLQYVRFNTSSDIDKANGQKVSDLNSLRLFAWASY